jgi:hypothetical protein
MLGGVEDILITQTNKGNTVSLKKKKKVISFALSYRMKHKVHYQWAGTGTCVHVEQIMLDLSTCRQLRSAHAVFIYENQIVAPAKAKSRSRQNQAFDTFSVL